MLKKLTRYARSKGITVIFDRTIDIDLSSYNNIINTIFIGTKGRKSYKLATLAHEIGHAEQVKNFNAESSLYYYELNRLMVKYGIVRWDLVMLEMGAWKRAERVLKSLGYKSWGRFNRRRSEALSSFFKAYYLTLEKE